MKQLIVPYSIRGNATDYQKELFNKLEEDYLTSPDSIEVAEDVAMSFVADFFTLSNKQIKNDVGGAQFFNEEYRINFREKAINSYYFALEQWIMDYGLQNLPTVEDITIIKSELGDSFETCSVSLTWIYRNVTFDTSKLQNKGEIHLRYNKTSEKWELVAVYTSVD